MLVLGSKLLVVGDLLFNLSDSGLQTRLLQCLRLLVGIDLLLGNQVIEGFSGILGNDGIDFCGRILYKAT